MELWIARDQDNDLNLYLDKPRIPNWPGRQCWSGDHFAMLDNYFFPEVTFENSPQIVELKLMKKVNSSLTPNQ